MMLGCTHACMYMYVKLTADIPNMIDAPDMYMMIIEGNENLERNTVIGNCM